MAVASSGAISLNDFHVEAGGSSGSNCSINDSDIRGLISKSAGASMSFNEWYGASGTLDNQTVTMGTQAAVGYPIFFGSLHGFSSDSQGGWGSISDGTCNFKSGADYEDLWWGADTYGNGNEPAGLVQLVLDGTHANSGWSTMKIASTTFNRTDAAFTQQGGETIWKWSNITSNPFGTTSNGATVAVEFA